MTKLSRRETLAGILAAGAGIAAPEARAASGASPAARLSFLHVNDVYRIGEDKNGRGGLARYAAAVKAERERARAQNRHLICVHSGDTLSPSLMSSFDQGAHMIGLFNEAGLNIFVPGNHEFDFGKDVYFERMKEARFTILAANLKDKNGAVPPYHKEWLLIDAGGIKLALIGAAYEDTPAASNPGDLVFSPAIPAVAASAKAARAAGAGFVVAIIHADKQKGGALMNMHAADLILSGHNHDLHVDFDGRTALVESQQDANFVTVADINAAKSPADGALTWWPEFRIIDTATVNPDPSMLAKVRGYQARLDKHLEVEIATLAAPLDSRTETVRSAESAIGNLFADALRAAASAEIAIINGGGIRGNRLYPAGSKFTKHDVLDELPFGNKTVVNIVAGKEILAALENGFSRIESLSGRFPQVSGLAVFGDPAAPPGARVKRATVNDAALDPSRGYRLAANDFMARGGDGYGMLAGKTQVTADSGTRLVALDVIGYIETLKTVDAKVEGRIVFE
ncbi:MAG: bifunctional metallophosphatase/5'-nucleotidase [Beijerinckiaceae bacterium]|nr:bifunctional metallophosphatase/5'-nucleotidase [Beijerinckiaceae bacterium]